MFHLVTSNRWEALIDPLLRRLDTAGAPRSPLQPHTLAVHSLAHRRALSMAIAQRQGVAINLRFVYLAQWLWRQMAAVVPGIAADSPFDAGTLAWRIDRCFADASFVQGRARLAPYLDACDEAMRFDFARRTAHIVEHYTTYRSDWLHRWSQNEAVAPPTALAAGTRAHQDWLDDEAWQRALWLRLVGALDLNSEHPARRFVQALRAKPDAARAVLPPELHVVAPAALAPLHLLLLVALAQVIDVHVYTLNPSQAYWVDVISDKRKAVLESRGSVRRLYADAGHPLLAAWGAQMQAQHALLQEHLDGDIDEHEAFVEPQGDSRLARMQRAMLHLDGDVTDHAGGVDKDVGEIDDDASGHDDAASGHDDAASGRDNDASGRDNDASVEIHVCHSLRRELEALQQRLLTLFAQADAPAAHEVLLVTPNIDDAAPMVDAVFGAATGSARMAYSITGRANGDDGGAAAALLQLLDVGTGRCTAEDLSGLTHTPLVAQRMGWTGDGLATLREWIGQSGMRFGLNSAHREAMHLPPGDAHTLDDALDRLLLGHAMASHTSTSSLPDAFAGKLPAAHVGGTHAALLGSLAGLQAQLSQWRLLLARPHPPADWHQHLLWAVDTFLRADTPSEHEGLRALRLTLAQWHARLRAAGEDRALSARLMRLSLEAELQTRAMGAVPSGSISFASMTGLRRLPYRVVVVFGLNDGAWGASSSPPEWDLMARAPRLGDRQRRHDERDVLLDLMLAARSHFWISTTGRDQRNNHELAPAAVVDEWIEALAAADNVSPDAMRKRIVVMHPLQPFAPELFASNAPVTLRSHHHGYAQALIDRARHAQATANLDIDAANDADASNGMADDMAEEAADGMADDTVDNIARDTPNGATEDADKQAAEVDGNDTATLLFTRPLAPFAGPHRITVPELQAFFANPAKALLQRRLGIALPRQDDALRNDEPFVLNALDRAQLARRLMPALRAGTDPEALTTHAQASGVLPAAALGHAVVTRELHALVQQADLLGALGEPQALRAELPFDVGGNRWQLVVDTSYLPGRGRVLWCAGKYNARHRLDAWIEHLALNALVDDIASWRTHMVTRDKHQHLGLVPDAMHQLHGLMALMHHGLHQPLPFMPDLSWHLAVTPSRPQQGTTDDEPANTHNPFDERLDPWVMLAWRGRSLMAAPDLGAVARKVYGPLEDAARKPEPV